MRKLIISEFMTLDGVFMMVDHFISHKTSFEVAPETFDRVKHK